VIRVGISLLTQDRGQFTGTSTYVRELVRELGGRAGNGELELEALCNPYAAARLDGIAGDRVRVKVASGYQVGDSRAGRLAAMALATAWPGRIARQFSGDLQIVHYPLTSNIPRVRLPTVTTLHDIQHHELPELFSRHQLTWRRLVYDRAAARSTLVITDSEFSRERIVEVLGIDSADVVAIHLGVDRARFTPDPRPRDEELLAALPLPDGPFALYPASLWPHKNHVRLLDALAGIGDRSLALVLTGATFGRIGELRSHAAKLGLADRVHHLGFVADDALPALYRRARVVVFPSRYEGFGAPPLEAMACGCPVASSLVASLAEVCDDAVEPLEPDHPEQMAAAIARVAFDEELRRSLRARGLAQAARFSWADAAQAHLQTYLRAAERTP
jgi:glycosyltransferase involved in cell wall biosynthesis